ncbi:MAG: tRNA preQ1(34) S-adenosylmethionine ribosyltransferase-isomerase QueA [Candidatus Nomurabacteria bacterium]|jgi:S-adenosylmethionine:tRNA ribosyltransferase-isomerase|nr:tRNA preQ1(34) S-adenosylmethionine ribosyltransferase-isomerase QueA [Candidatus Nomurabacteria bacterium]
MKVADYSYDLPEDLIAHFPSEQRGTSRLLILERKTGAIKDKKYFDVVDCLRAGDVLVLNNTKVIKSRLKVMKPSGALRELVILEKHGVDDNWHRHKVLYRGSLKTGDKLRVISSFSDDLTDKKSPSPPPVISKHKLVVEEILGDGLAVVKSQDNLLKIAEKFGAVPLPPYLNREANSDDIKRYQTIFAKKQGSAAAPTASLNMTDEILTKMQRKGVIVKYLTLHVGLGTFLPIRTDRVEEHQIHSEYFEIPTETVRAISLAKREKRRVVAVGTTVARTLEHCHQELGGYSLIVSHLTKKVKSTSDKTLLSPQNQTVATPNRQNALRGEANIFIYPGYHFQIVDALLTNFHAPKSTVLMLSAAFAGWENLEKAYLHAITHHYRFLSYGDSMLIV